VLRLFALDCSVWVREAGVRGEPVGVVACCVLSEAVGSVAWLDCVCLPAVVLLLVVLSWLSSCVVWYISGETVSSSIGSPAGRSPRLLIVVVEVIIGLVVDSKRGRGVRRVRLRSLVSAVVVAGCTPVNFGCELPSSPLRVRGGALGVVAVPLDECACRLVDWALLVEGVVAVAKWVMSFAIRRCGLAACGLTSLPLG